MPFSWFRSTSASKCPKITHWLANSYKKVLSNLHAEQFYTSSMPKLQFAQKLRLAFSYALNSIKCSQFSLTGQIKFNNWITFTYHCLPPSPPQVWRACHINNLVKNGIKRFIDPHVVCFSRSLCLEARLISTLYFLGLLFDSVFANIRKRKR